MCSLECALTFLNACTAGFPIDYSQWHNNSLKASSNATTGLEYAGACPVPLLEFPKPVPRCYSPSTHVCVNGQSLCPLSAPQLCGNQVRRSEEHAHEHR